MKNVLIFDIDGTLANCNERLPHILQEPVNWDTFDSLIHTDTPILGMIRLLQIVAINPLIDIILLTGRADRNTVRYDTIEWLKKQGIIELQTYDHLIMRGADDRRPASIVKLEHLSNWGYTPDSVITIFEDDPMTIKDLRAADYHVCNVDNRIFMPGEHEGGPE